jgi:hypothetical protein
MLLIFADHILLFKSTQRAVEEMEQLMLHRRNYLYCASEEEVLANVSGFGGLVVSMLASGTQVYGFKPGRKNPQHAFLQKGSKAVCLMSQICGMLHGRQN